MNYTQMMTAIALSLFIGSATADCLSSVMPQKDGAITWSDLAKYDACLKADKAGAVRKPLTLSQDTWAAACTSRSFTDNKCFGGDPATDAETKLVLQVTNIYAVANLSLDATYPAGSIWIGQFPAGNYNSSLTSFIPASGTNLVQAVCGAFTEIGWAVPSVGLNANITTSKFISDSSYITNGGQITSSTDKFTMLGNTAFGLKTPLYIICVGRNTATFTPAALASGFAVTWS